MSSASSAQPSASGKTSFTPALILLGLAVVINYVDRGNLSMAGTIVQRELKLSSAQLGFLFSAFFYTYMARSEEHTSELQSPDHLVCRLLLEKKKKNTTRLPHQ